MTKSAKNIGIHDNNVGTIQTYIMQHHYGNINNRILKFPL